MRGHKGPADGGTGEQLVVVRCSWSWLALAAQLLLRCCRASPTPRRMRGVRVREQEQRENPRQAHLERRGAAVGAEGRYQSLLRGVIC